jgi:hypothetical protein
VRNRRQHMVDNKKYCDCEICRTQIEFEFPEELLSDFLTRAVTIFAGGD